MERCLYDISDNIRIFCQVHSSKQIRSSSYGSKVTSLQHILLQVTEDGFDHGGENWGHFNVWRTTFPECQVLNFLIPRNWDYGWQGTEWPSKKCYWWDTLSATVPVSRNLEIKHLILLCEIGSLSGCRLLKYANTETSFSRHQNDLSSLLRGQSHLLLPATKVMWSKVNYISRQVVTL